MKRYIVIAQVHCSRATISGANSDEHPNRILSFMLRFRTLLLVEEAAYFRLVFHCTDSFRKPPRVLDPEMSLG